MWIRLFLFGILFPLSFPVSSLSQVDHSDLFAKLNLEYPGLELVKDAYTNGDLPAARRHLLYYFQHRKNRVFYNLSFEEDVKKADQNSRNIFHLKSSSYEFGDHIDWKMIHPDREWQFTLNKMKWFLNYVGVYQKTGDEKYVLAWMKQIESWIALGRPGFPRTIDTGRRLDNWVISYWWFVQKLQSPSVTPEFHAKLLLSMAEQADFLYRPEHWRRYSNWGSFENSGLSKLAVLFPEFNHTRMWLREIFFRMRFQLEHSFYSDGMHVEVSPGYHSHELQVWFDFYRLARLNGIEDPWHPQIALPSIKQRFLSIAKALLFLSKPDGSLPQVGDTDRANEQNFLLKLGRYFHDSELIYGGSNGREGRPPAETSKAFPEGGYYILRSGWGEKNRSFNKELYLLFDCGSNRPWHAHYDMLNIVASAYGHDLLIDAGRYTYNQGKEREYFKSTAAHNTVVVDHTDQPRQYKPRAAEWHSFAGYDYVIGAHAGYPDVVHRRSVFFVKPEYWIVVDRLSGNRAHQFDLYWHLNEEAKNNLQIVQNGQNVKAPHLLLLSLNTRAEFSVAKSFHSDQYRQKIETPVIRYSSRHKPGVVFTTVLFPFENQPPKIVVKNERIRKKICEEKNHRDVLVSVSSPQYVDIFFEREENGKTYKDFQYETDARCFLIRLDRRKHPLKFHMIDGKYLKYGNHFLIQIRGSRSDVAVERKRVQLVGNSICQFSIEFDANPPVFLNGQKIEVENKGGILKYDQFQDAPNDK